MLSAITVGEIGWVDFSFLGAAIQRIGIAQTFAFPALVQLALVDGGAGKTVVKSNVYRRARRSGRSFGAASTRYRLQMRLTEGMPLGSCQAL